LDKDLQELYQNQYIDYQLIIIFLFSKSDRFRTFLMIMDRWGLGGEGAGRLFFCHPEGRRIFFALLVADLYSEEDPSLRSG
jgi:hypothetical protein